ncbi:MAG: Rrf2 family transcriptional regulator [Actinomycetota bacterium]|nr:Rrf2 family transcriptional regulator [Actinomycetota bacterium]
MYISAKVDYGTRALLALAVAPSGRPVKGEVLAEEQDLPLRFVENILVELRRAGLVTSQRGAEGGYRLARPPNAITLADVFRALEGPLADVRGLRPEDARYEGPAEHLRDIWVAVRAALRAVLERVTLADVAAGEFPEPVVALLADPEAWHRR